MKNINIVAFLCNWCGYAGADLAGVSRIQYPATTRTIRIMCTGRMSPSFITKAFIEGADGVLICGCHPGDCHYKEGNLKAEKMVKNMEMALDMLGLDSRRLRLEWISATEGVKFAKVVKDFTEKLIELESNPIRCRNW